MEDATMPAARFVSGVSFSDRSRSFGNDEKTDMATLQEFWATAIGPVKKVTLAYTLNGKSRGEATIVFAKADSASRAFNEFNNVPIDGKPIKVEVVGTVTAGETKSLADRIA
jgi:hypothetical protein